MTSKRIPPEERAADAERVRGLSNSALESMQRHGPPRMAAAAAGELARRHERSSDSASED